MTITEFIVCMLSGSVGYFFGLWSSYWWCQGVIDAQEREIERLNDNLDDDFRRNIFNH